MCMSMITMIRCVFIVGLGNMGMRVGMVLAEGMNTVMVEEGVFIVAPI